MWLVFTNCCEAVILGFYEPRNLGEVAVVVNTATPNSIEFTLPSELAAQQVVHERIVTQIRNAGSTSRDEFCIRLALEEALTNAIRHGNKLSPDKKVFVKSTVDGGAVTIEIADEGDGFVQVDVPDPTADENLGRPTGRGVLLIQSFMDDVRYNEQGNEVTMVKVLGSLTETQ